MDGRIFFLSSIFLSDAQKENAIARIENTNRMAAAIAAQLEGWCRAYERVDEIDGGKAVAVPGGAN